jgi:hypothetical protein
MKIPAWFLLGGLRLQSNDLSFWNIHASYGRFGSKLNSAGNNKLNNKSLISCWIELLAEYN